MLYLLQSWEINGYHDSDFYGAFWDTETQTVRRIEMGSTRYASQGNPMLFSTELTVEIVQSAIYWLEDVVYDAMSAAASNRINRPDTISVGDKVCLTAAKKGHKYAVEHQICEKCGGSGQWVNPNYSDDVRECFGCNGAGSKLSYVKVTNPATGKPAWDMFEPGTKGTVIWVGTFNQIYANGCNKWGRNTISARILTDDNRIASVSLSQLRLDEEMPSNQSLRSKAKLYASRCTFGQMLDPRFAWDSSNPALSFCNRVGYVG